MQVQDFTNLRHHFIGIINNILLCNVKSKENNKTHLPQLNKMIIIV